MDYSMVPIEGAKLWKTASVHKVFTRRTASEAIAAH